MPFAKYITAVAPCAANSADAPVSAERIAQALAAEPDLARRAKHLAALVAHGSAAAVAALAELLRHADPAVRAAGADGLRMIEPVLARPALAALLDDPSPDIRIRALDAIDRVPDAQVEACLIALLERERVDNVCGVVLDLLAEIGTQAAIPAIRAARLRFASTPFIAFAADLALAQIVEG